MTVQDSQKTALVTGGNAGLGFETCKGLLEAGFHVVVCARSAEKGEDAVARLLAAAPAGSTAESLVLDLASLASVRAAGPLLGTLRPTPLPPGRGRLVTRDRGVETVQVAWSEPAV